MCHGQNSETWTLKTTQQNRLKVFEMSCLRKIKGVTRRDHIRNEDIFDRPKLSQDIQSRIQQRRLRYFGHVSRMGQDRYPKLALEGYVHGQRGRGRPKKRWLDVVRSDCADMGLTVHDAKSSCPRQRRLETIHSQAAVACPCRSIAIRQGTSSKSRPKLSYVTEVIPLFITLTCE